MQNSHDDGPPLSGDARLTERALDELAAECQIPEHLEEHILARALGDEPPVVKVPSGPSAPLDNVIRLGREEDRRWTWLGRAGAAAVALIVAAVVALTPRGGPLRGGRGPRGDLHMASVAPSGMRATEVPQSHTRLVEARRALSLVAGRVVETCRAPTFMTLVRFERSGQASVLEVASSEVAATSCVEKAVAGARVSASGGPRLAVRYERSPQVTRISGWLLDET